MSGAHIQLLHLSVYCRTSGRLEKRIMMRAGAQVVLARTARRSFPERRAVALTSQCQAPKAAPQRTCSMEVLQDIRF